MHPPVLSSKLQKIRTEIDALSSQERQTLLQTLLAEKPLLTKSEMTPKEPVHFIVPVTPTPLEPALLN